MAKQTVSNTKKTTTTKISFSMPTTKTTEKKRCPSCGKFMGGGGK